MPNGKTAPKIRVGQDLTASELAIAGLGVMTVQELLRIQHGLTTPDRASVILSAVGQRSDSFSRRCWLRRSELRRATSAELVPRIPPWLRSNRLMLAERVQHLSFLVSVLSSRSGSHRRSCFLRTTGGFPRAETWRARSKTPSEPYSIIRPRLTPNRSTGL